MEVTQRRTASRDEASGAARCTLAGLPLVVLGAFDAFASWPVESVTEPVALVAGTTVLVGPYNSENALRGCARCIALRWQELRPPRERGALEALTAREDRFEAAGPLPGTCPGWLRMHEPAVVKAIGLLTASLSASRSGDGAELAWLLSVDLRTGRTSSSPFLAHSRCPSCAPTGSGGPAAPRLPGAVRHSRFARFSTPVDRLQLPSKALVDPTWGALGARIDRGFDAPPLASSGGMMRRWGPRGLTDIGWGGQQRTFSASVAAAVLEGLERDSGTANIGGQPEIVATYDDIADHALDLNTLGIRIDERRTHEWFALDRHTPTTWIWLRPLRRGRPKLVPKQCVYYNSGDTSPYVVQESSSGCSVGSSLTEAVLGGLLEVIERDAFLLGWYRALPLTQIDDRSVPGTSARQAVACAAARGYTLRFFDNRIDLPVPVVCAVAERDVPGEGAAVFAAAADLDAVNAIDGAACEVLSRIPIIRDEVRGRPDLAPAALRNFDLIRTLADHAVLPGIPGFPELAPQYFRPKTVGGYERLYGERRPRPADLRQDVDHILDALEERGHHAYVVEQTSREQKQLGLHSARVVVPGLLPIDFGWDRQRALTMKRLRAAQPRFLPHPASSAPGVRRVPHPFP